MSVMTERGRGLRVKPAMTEGGRKPYIGKTLPV